MNTEFQNQKEILITTIKQWKMDNNTRKARIFLRLLSIQHTQSTGHRSISDVINLLLIAKKNPSNNCGFFVLLLLNSVCRDNFPRAFSPKLISIIFNAHRSLPNEFSKQPSSAVYCAQTQILMCIKKKKTKQKLII